MPAFSLTPFHLAISPAIWVLSASGVELRALADYRKSLVVFERVQEAPSGGGGGVANAINAITLGSPTCQ